MQTENVRGKEFSNLKFTTEEMANGYYAECTFVNCDLSEIRMDSCSLTGCTFIECDFDRTMMYDLSVAGTEFRSCSFRRACFAEADLKGAHFSNCNFHNCIGDGERIYTLVADPEFFVTVVDEFAFLGCHKVRLSQIRQVTAEQLSKIDPAGGTAWERGKAAVISLVELWENRNEH